MSAAPTTDEVRSIACVLEGWELPDDFQMPTLEELENDLALRNPGWKAMLRPLDESGDQAHVGVMGAPPSSPRASGGRGYHGPATWCESHPIVPDEFVCGYLKGRGVTDAVAESVAREASKAFRDSPYWHATSAGRAELILRLYWTLDDGGHTSQSAKLTGDLLKELSKRRVVGTDRMSPR